MIIVVVFTQRDQNQMKKHMMKVLRKWPQSHLKCEMRFWWLNSANDPSTRVRWASGAAKACPVSHRAMLGWEGESQNLGSSPRHPQHPWASSPTWDGHQSSRHGPSSSDTASDLAAFLTGNRLGASSTAWETAGWDDPSHSPTPSVKWGKDTYLVSLPMR